MCLHFSLSMKCKYQTTNSVPQKCRNLQCTKYCRQTPYICSSKKIKYITLTPPKHEILIALSIFQMLYTTARTTGFKHVKTLLSVSHTERPKLLKCRKIKFYRSQIKQSLQHTGGQVFNSIAKSTASSVNIGLCHSYSHTNQH